ncbi:hypothetical protein V3C99_007508 [Haemonchus contortus]|uniref:Apple domain-containing protein n=1 Tax=Haemonchus contortus TaxID=6289 RepID=A0A7I5EBI8_HAECO
MWARKSLVLVLSILQVHQSRSCTFTQKSSPDYSDGQVIYSNTSTSLYDCLRACYFNGSCYSVLFEKGQCTAFAVTNNSAYYDPHDHIGGQFYVLERASIPDPKLCAPVSPLL